MHAPYSAGRRHLLKFRRIYDNLQSHPTYHEIPMWHKFQSNTIKNVKLKFADRTNYCQEMNRGKM